MSIPDFRGGALLNEHNKLECLSNGTYLRWSLQAQCPPMPRAQLNRFRSPTNQVSQPFSQLVIQSSPVQSSPPVPRHSFSQSLSQSFSQSFSLAVRQTTIRPSNYIFVHCHGLLPSRYSRAWTRAIFKLQSCWAKGPMPGPDPDPGPGPGLYIWP